MKHNFTSHNELHNKSKRQSLWEWNLVETGDVGRAEKLDVLKQ